MFYPVKGAFPTKIDSNRSEVFFARQIVTTGIFKGAVDEPPMLRKLNINEDRQADLTVHGGEDKAIYTYPKKDQEYRNYELRFHNSINRNWQLYTVKEC